MAGNAAKKARLHRSGKHYSDLVTGALVGVGVQVGVRLAGVS